MIQHAMSHTAEGDNRRETDDCQVSDYYRYTRYLVSFRSLNPTVILGTERRDQCYIPSAAVGKAVGSVWGGTTGHLPCVMELSWRHIVLCAV
jgi:hypothetical protein